jgi:hypothetical protein
LSGTAGVSEAQAERESAREILSERSESKDLRFERYCGRDSELAEGESKDLYLEPYA